MTDTAIAEPVSAPAGPAIQDAAPSAIFDKAVCVSVQLSALGTKRKVPKNLVEVDTDKSMLTISKEILKSPKLAKVKQLHSKVRRYLLEVCLPAQTLFRGGIYPIPIPLVASVDAELEKYKAEIEAAVEEFLEEYPKLITPPALSEDPAPEPGPLPEDPELRAIMEARREKMRMAREQNKSVVEMQLRALHNPREYPPVETVRKAFKMSVQYINMGVPGALAGISKSIFQREQEKAAVAVAEATEEVKAALRAGLKELVDHMVERLTPKDGDVSKPKKFHYTLVKNMRDFLGTFDARNVAEDTELASLVSKARQLLDGVEPDKLRENTNLREYVLEGMSSIKGNLDTMVVEGPTRLIFGEDDDENETA